MDALPEETYSRFIRAADGCLVKRYSAIDPANESVWCACGKPMCPRARLLPFREHVARLHEILAEVMEEASLHELATGVLENLRLAASLEDIEADTGYVDDPMVFAVCETTIDYENARSEMASKYVAGLVTFQFLWHAYEMAVSSCAPSELRRLLKEQCLGERGRRLFENRRDLCSSFPGLSSLVHLTIFQCREGGRMGSRLDRLEERYKDRDLIAAAEIVREFRNVLFHGEDEVPDHENWDLASAGAVRCRLYRSYTVSRLVLYLIQALTAIMLREGDPKGEVSAEALHKLGTLQFRADHKHDEGYDSSA